MKQKTTIFLFLICSAANLFSQPKKETYHFKEDINTSIEKDTVAWKYQSGAVSYSMSGYYQEALEAWDKNGATIPKITKEDSLYFKSFKPKNAKEYIINRSKSEQVVIINEAHNNSRHRVFTTSLLQELYNNGYCYLGIEALSDSLINTTKFAIEKTGFYTKESQFANLIHEAIKIGFTLFNYEYTSEKRITGKEREIEQALNISKIIKANPNAKFLIYCGYDHLIEGVPRIKSWEKAMAGRLTEMTGINPFTIDQISSSERGQLKLNNPYIQMVNLDYPVIMINDNGETFNGKINNDTKIDCSIIHPITKYNNGRPNWLTLSGERKTYKIPNSIITEYPALVLAYRNNEFEQNGIPADIIEISDKNQIGNLILSKGDYKITIKNRQYNIVKEYLHQVK
ncbi:hypothetical protein OA93_00790 [Flavobacterium sp. KMS]|uniref:hypothetical protein n=1 Tax=Flavobacterium sp. KMS TaxID=1566023 RepID=UPI00057C5753|nr:hypothetical protein [Flavobacterium sp. KMS]KIC00182.1 hypothetical protein OA93_00790 [Flavobacterium sp. KMS]